MAHEYSVQIHEWIKKSMDDTLQDMKRPAAGHESAEHYLKGRMEELFAIRQYLTDKIDLDTHQYYP